MAITPAVQVSDPYVLRVLINAANIERTTLAADRKLGDDILKSLGGGGVAWTADHMRVTRYPYVRVCLCPAYHSTRANQRGRWLVHQFAKGKGQ